LQEYFGISDTYGRRLQWVGVCPALGENRSSSSNFDRIACKSTGAVTFQIASLMEVCDACCCVRSADRDSLSFSGGTGDTCDDATTSENRTGE
jgi:hypothetical protein